MCSAVNSVGRDSGGMGTQNKIQFSVFGVQLNKIGREANWIMAFQHFLASNSVLGTCSTTSRGGDRA